MYKSIIFDLDGTLVDSSKGIVNAAMETLKILEYPPMTEEEIDRKSTRLNSSHL